MSKIWGALQNMGCASEIRWLPVACPELNPVDHLWRHFRADVLANEPEPDLDASLERSYRYLLSLTPFERLRKAGVISGSGGHCNLSNNFRPNT